jgi:lipoprotein-anchoring transpeptidase ErfK/SrfK
MGGVNGYQGSGLTGRKRFFSPKADFLNNTAFSKSLWQVAIVAAAGILGASSAAEAATSIFWSDSEPGIYRQVPVGPQRRHKARYRQDLKNGPKGVSAAKETAKPQGPLIIAISIERQSLKIYDANGLFAESPVSTGMRGHSTPMGVFSIIQKHKFHHSNIYSGAPMPYMQRITWSGVAMHAGVLPGYPASHGCIRMPMSFAMKLWGWTKMGARVVVTPGELTPSSFAHPLLSPKPAPVAAALTTGPAAEAAVTQKQSQTADASAAAVTMSDAAPSARTPAATDKRAQAAAIEAKPDAADPVAKAAHEASVQDHAGLSADLRPTSDQPADNVEPTAPASSADATQAPASEAAKQVSKEAPNETVNADTAEPNKDQARAADADKAAAKETKEAAKPEPGAAPKRAGQIAVFISRKDNKLYVRQNFTPLFETPVTITPGDRPLGTHVFTARADKDDPRSFHWSVVSLPMARHAERRGDDERALRRRTTVGAVEMKPPPTPDSPAEALDRITIPADAMARITDALATGGSIVVSDQGIAAGETGEGTDFIVSLR